MTDWIIMCTIISNERYSEVYEKTREGGSMNKRKEEVCRVDSLIRKNLKQILQDRKLTQTDLAAMINVNPVLISQIIGGVKGLGKTLMKKVCKALSVEVYQFFLTPNSPVIRDEEELKFMMLMREAKRLNKVDEIMKFIRFSLSDAQLEEMHKKNAGLLEKSSRVKKPSAG